jgi:hypothetical protein
MSRCYASERKIMSQLVHADISNWHAVTEATEAMHLLRLVGLSMETRGWGAIGEVAGEDWLEEGAEDNLSTTRDCQRVKSSGSRGYTYPVWGRAIQSTRTNLKV